MGGKEGKERGGEEGWKVRGGGGGGMEGRGNTTIWKGDMSTRKGGIQQ